MVENKINNEKCPEGESPPADAEKYRLGVRHVQMLCMCVCLIMIFVSRSCMGVAVLAMTDHSKNHTDVPVYDWDKKTQGVILSSFFWGYTMMQVPAGMLAKRFGGKPILLVALLMNGLICLLIPVLAALGGWVVVSGARMVAGLAQACTFPATHTLLGRWLPARERTSIASFVYGGTQLGTIIALPVSGVLAETAGGWRSIFYTVGGSMLVAGALWYGLAASSPAEHWFIGSEERSYIEIQLSCSGNNTAPTPWRALLRSRPLWALLCTHVGVAIMFIIFFVEMPTYLEKGLAISLKNSALLSAVPYIGMWLSSSVSGVVSEILVNRGVFSLSTSRKIFNSIGTFGPAAGLVALSTLGPDNKTLAIITLFITLTLFGATFAGFMVNHLDLSPNFAGVLLSLTNFMANLISCGTPIFTSLILRNNPADVTRWRVVFLSLAGICVLTNTVYMLFGSAVRQPWDDPGYQNKLHASPEEIVPVMEEENERNNKKVEKL